MIIMFYVYILKSLKDKKLYVGYTNDLRKRLKEHNDQKSFSTKTRVPFELIYYEAYKSEKDARERERKLKYFGQGIRRIRERLKFSFN